MAQLAVRFDSGDFNYSVKRLKSSIESRYNDYDGIKKDIAKVPTRRSNLNTSGSYLQRKLNSLDSRLGKLEGFRSNVASFCEYAKEVDIAVANRIKGDSKTVYKALGIKTGFAAVVCTILKASAIALIGTVGGPIAMLGIAIVQNWKSIKKWYVDKFLPWWNDGGKYIVGAVVFLALSVVTLGAALGAASAWAAVAAYFTFATTFATLTAKTEAIYLHYIVKDKEAAKEMSGMGLRNAFQWVGGTVDYYLGTGTFFTDTLLFAHDGLALYSAIYSIGKLGMDAIKAYRSDGLWSTCKTLLGIDGLGKQKENVQMSLFGYEYKGVTFKTVEGYLNYKTFSKNLSSLKQIYDCGKSILEGNFLKGSGKIGDKVGELWDKTLLFINSWGNMDDYKFNYPEYIRFKINQLDFNKIPYLKPAYGINY